MAAGLASIWFAGLLVRALRKSSGKRALNLEEFYSALFQATAVEPVEIVDLASLEPNYVETYDLYIVYVQTDDGLRLVKAKTRKRLLAKIIKFYPKP